MADPVPDWVADLVLDWRPVSIGDWMADPAGIGWTTNKSSGRRKFMMKNRVFGLFLAGVFAAALAFMGCENPASGGGDDGNANKGGIAVNGVSLDSAARSVPQGSTITLTETVSPNDAANKAVAWASSNQAIATVSSGKVTGVAQGSATITVTTADGAFTATCAVTVTPPVTNITVSPTTLTAYYGEELDLTGLTMTVTYASGSDTVPVTRDLLGEFDPENTTGPQTVAVNYGGKAQNITITVKPVTSITVTTPTNYYIGEVLGAVAVTANYDGPHTRPLASGEFTVSGFNSASEGDKTLTVTYGTATKNVSIKVWHKITAVTVTPATTQLSASDIASGKTIPFTAKIEGPATSPQTVTWSIVETGKNAGTSISTAGVLTIASDETLKRLTVKAESTYQSGHPDDTAAPKKSGTADVIIPTIITVTSTETWTGAFSTITSENSGTAANPGVWVLNITGNITAAATASITGNHKEVWLTGAGTIALGSTSGSVLQIGADQTFVLDGPTLTGKTGNNASLVKVGGGAFTMKSGTISGNKNTTGNDRGFGGGVYVAAEAAFTMTDGEISGNEDSGHSSGNGPSGDGVFVDGTFVMNGGTVKDNTGDYDNGIGGVWVSGKFTMGGTAKVSDNKNLPQTASRDGDPFGGTGVGVRGNFRMDSGTISGNKDGGVGVNTAPNANEDGLAYRGKFTMKDGTISGNSTSSVQGGGVSVTGIFVMEGGVIKGNSALIGGGVLVMSTVLPNIPLAEFTMINGTIEGNTATGIPDMIDATKAGNAVIYLFQSGKNDYTYFYRSAALNGTSVA
jgi:hypothetical protein